MPKYVPDDNDIWETKPCFVCGRDVVEPGKETCCDLCEQQMIIFKEDFEASLWESHVDEYEDDL